MRLSSPSINTVGVSVVRIRRLSRAPKNERSRVREIREGDASAEGMTILEEIEADLDALVDAADAAASEIVGSEIDT